VATATGAPGQDRRSRQRKRERQGHRAVHAAATPRQLGIKTPKDQTLTTKTSATTSAAGAMTTEVTHGTADFQTKVTNTGNVTLTDVHATDPLSRSCDRKSANIAGLASLAPGGERYLLLPSRGRSGELHQCRDCHRDTSERAGRDGAAWHMSR
jgi:hypothetical protein